MTRKNVLTIAFEIHEPWRATTISVKYACVLYLCEVEALAPNDSIKVSLASRSEQRSTVYETKLAERDAWKRVGSNQTEAGATHRRTPLIWIQLHLGVPTTSQ